MLPKELAWYIGYRWDMPNCMADEDDVWLPFSVGIDFDDNGKDKEKKHIMRHLKKRKVVFQITQPYFQILLSYQMFWLLLLREFRDEQNWRSFSVKIQIMMLFFSQIESLIWSFMPKNKNDKMKRSDDFYFWIWVAVTAKGNTLVS